jgi:CBS-domain-containing membrane protein
MTKNNLRFSFIVDENQKVVDTVDYFNLTLLTGPSQSIEDVPKEYRPSHYPTLSISGDTFLESLLDKAADTKVPLVINDDQGRIQGVISRETILTTLQSA